jgi:hypothetical protein
MTDDNSEKCWYAPKELAGVLTVKPYHLTEEEIAARKAFLEELNAWRKTPEGIAAQEEINQAWRK